ncbi:MAG: glycerophosphodiester phosphodiesterase [Rhizobiaceae bacterium]
MKQILQSAAMTLVDALMAVIPRKKPERAVLENCKIISHRGEHNRNTIPENSLEAFRKAEQAGVWGIEADIRWTADLIPVIIHDPDTLRVFGKPITVADVEFAELRSRVPEVPSLAELVEEFGHDTHLMLELKQERFPQLERQKQLLNQHLSGLTPGRDYHILALDTALFETFDIQPRNCCLSVALANSRTMSKMTLPFDYGGLTGHYLLLCDRIKRRHEDAGQKIGTGFIRSRNSLYRELNRGVEWIFSNDAVRLQGFLEQ